MLTKHDPAAIAAPFSTYSHGVEAASGLRWLHVSGQVGAWPDGTLAIGPEAQMEQAWRNLFAVLEAVGMGPDDLVKVTAMITRREDVPFFRQMRKRMLGDARPASTLMIVAGLAHSEWLVEIEAVAAA